MNTLTYNIKKLPAVSLGKKAHSYDLSMAQKQMWFVAQSSIEASISYNLSFGFCIKGDLNKKALLKALNTITEKNEILRCSFPSNKGIPYCFVASSQESNFLLTEINISDIKNNNSRLREIIDHESLTPFNLEKGPLIRGKLIKTDEIQHNLILNVHHLIFDGWSHVLFYEELTKLYNMYNRNALTLYSTEIQYFDYSQWQKKWITKDFLRPQRNYWFKKLRCSATFNSPLPDFDRPNYINHDGRFLGHDFSHSISKKLKSLSKKNRVSLYTTILSSWAILISKLSGTQDIIIGTATANRKRKEALKIIGLFSSILPLRIKFNKDTKVCEYLTQVKNALKESIKNQDIPLGQVVSDINPIRSQKHQPLFQSSFSWALPPKSIPHFSGLEVSPLEMITEKYNINDKEGIKSESDKNLEFILSLFGGANLKTKTKFDLAPIFWEFDNKIVGAIEYSSELFKKKTIQRYLSYWNNIIESMIKDDQQSIINLQLMNHLEFQQVIRNWNNTQININSEQCVHELFETQALQTPHEIAIAQKNIILTYEQLNNESNQLANYFKKLNIQIEDKIAICVEKSPKMLIGLLAIIKSGATYVPLDRTYPIDRLNYMLSDSNSKILLVDDNTESLFKNKDYTLINVNSHSVKWSNFPTKNLKRSQTGISPRHLVYVVYTSGSTGTPKGVLVEHCNIIELVYWHCKTFQLKTGQKLSCVASIGFDACAWEIWPTLCAGATLYLPTEIESRSPELLLEWWQSQPLDTSFLPTPLAELAFRHNIINPNLKQLLVGGDRLKQLPNDVHTFKLFNNYGPTESTVVATCGEIDFKDKAYCHIHIGRPVTNTQVYVLDPHLQPVPIGVTGELYISGGGLARGYLNQDELTQKSFIPNPFDKNNNNRLYKTGDLVCWRDDGNLDYIGRNDFQVKLRGFRIELGEIESHLQKHPLILTVVVLLNEDSVRNQLLVAYYIPLPRVNDYSFDTNLRQFLLSRLPEYMVPSAFVELQKLPLTPNGKVDKKVLRTLQIASMTGKTLEPPQSELETIIANVWSELVAQERVSRHDNFFDIGGHSLLAVQVISRLRQVLNINVTINDLFTHPVLSDLAVFIGQAQQQKLPPINQVNRENSIPLSFAQQRLWFLSQIGPHVSRAYHMRFDLKLIGRLNVLVLRRALDEIVCRHEALRTTFSAITNEPVQIIHDHKTITLQEHDLSDQTNAPTILFQLTREEINTPFNLSTGPLIRGRLIKINRDEYHLLITQHHILSDGWSYSILVNELSQLYSALIQNEPCSLTPLTIQYADFAHWQRHALTGEILEQQTKYWMSQLSNAPTHLELPTDYPRPLEQSYAGDLVELSIDKTLSDAIRSLCQRHGTTMFMTLLSSWAILLSRLSGQNDLVIGTPTANRNRQELEQLIGFFVNALALRIDLSGEPSVDTLLERVKTTALQALQHQDIPFEQVVDLIQPERSLGHNPLFQVAFAWQNAPAKPLELEDLTISPLPRVEHTTSIFDLSLHLWDNDDGISGCLEYSTDLFTKNTVERFLSYWQSLLRAMVDDTQQTINQLPIMSEANRKQILHNWNKTKVDFSNAECVHRLFEAQVLSYPKTIAVKQGQQELTYTHLNYQANKLAHHLFTFNVKPDDKVVICMERSPNLIIGLLAILKAGAAYVPMDSASPKKRLNYLLEDSQPKVLIVDEYTENLFEHKSKKLPIINLRTDAHHWHALSSKNIAVNEIGLDVCHLAYVIYTSGSTGNPKGVLVEHQNLNELVHWHSQTFKLKAKQQTSCVAGIGFDACAWEIWSALCAGATLCLPSETESRNPDLLLQWWQSQPLDISFLPTPLAELAFQQNAINPQLKRLLVGGDRLKQLPDDQHSFQLFNNYGPTESTVVATCGEINYQGSSDNQIHIGRPIANTQVYVLDAYLQPVPVGIIGELYIGGTGLAREYLNQDKLTNQSFISNPFDETGQSRLYKTGDLVRWRADGKLDYIGRNDFQVKLRGFRIELGEIENQLIKQTVVKDAVVLCDDSVKDKQLIAYLSLKDTNDLDLEANIKSEQIAKWQTLYNSTYAQSEDIETSEDYIGWNSSFTGLPIPDIEMQEWRDNTVKRIQSLRPNRLLEIGCGTGLLLFQVAPQCTEYVACDFSEETIQRLSHKVAQQNLGQVKLLHREANALADLPTGHFDTIVINSVIQYFPTAAYLLDVIRQALKLLTPTGKLMVGDVRNFDLFETFHTAIQLFKANSYSTLSNLAKQSKLAIENEKELLISPEFFLSLKKRLSSVAQVRVLPKLAQYQNELTHYRYDVMIEKQATNTCTAYSAIDWSKENYSTKQLIEQFNQGLTQPLLLSNIQNPRVTRSHTSTQILLNTDWSSSPTLDELDLLIDQQTQNYHLLDPQELTSLCQQYGYAVELSWLRTQGPDTYHAIISVSEEIDPPHSIIDSLPQVAEGQYANEPLKLSANIEVINHLKTNLQQILPDYMVPTHWMVLDKLPLNQNGKVDRKALPKTTTVSHQLDYVAPSTDEEKQLATIWGDLLTLKQVSIHDNFFEVGGQSLLAVQVISRLRQSLNIDVKLNELFNNPILSDFAKIITNAKQDTLPPITQVHRQQSIPLSFSQQRLWFLTQLGGHVSRAYHQPIGLRLEGKLDHHALKQALNQIVSRHETLRTTFSTVNDEPVQVIGDDHSFTLVEHDLTKESDVTSKLKLIIKAEANTAFDLHNGPLFRGSLVTISPSENILLITLHHILSDGWSISVLVRELSTLYAAYQQNKPNPLKPLQIQYADFSQWQRQCLATDLLSEQARYWQQLLLDPPALLELPTDFPRPNEQSYAGNLIEFRLAPALTNGVRALCKKHDTTMFMTLLTSWSILMSRLSNQQDIVIGTPTANRNHHELEGLIGFFVNTLALRIDLSRRPSIETLLARVKELSLRALQHQDIPFEQVVDLVQPKRSLSYNPLFQVAFAWQNAPAKPFSLNNLTISELTRVDHNTAIFDLSLHLWDSEESISGCLEYSTDLFEKDTIERYLGYWKALLKAMVANDQQRIDELPMINQAEHHQVLVQWNETDVDFNSEGCIHEMFENQVLNTPNATAVKQGDVELSYRALNQKANQIARHLLALGIQPDDRIAISVERGPSMIIALMAVLKAGAAYVPLAPEYPIERLNYMLEDSTPKAILVDENSLKLFDNKGINQPIIDIQNDEEKWSKLSTDNLNRRLTGLKPSHLAYVIYTSGSTGNPKGVLVEHRNVSNFVMALSQYFEIQTDDQFLQFASFSFDMFVFEFTMSLCRGATLCISEAPDKLVGEILANTVKKYSITHAILTPSALASIHDKTALNSIRVLIPAGEALSNTLVKYWQESIMLLNGYGPTETTVIATMHDCLSISGETNPPIGRPIPNTKLFVLDENQRPVPIGVQGELYIGGAGVTRGYLNRPELTNEKFTYLELKKYIKQRLYRTGDIVRWNKNGEVEYIGRNDSQIKLRGLRIELGEIEALISSYPTIQASIVAVREDIPGDKQIVTYYKVKQPNERERIPPSLIRQYLLRSLPDFMIPTAFVQLSGFPLTPNGKIDHRALKAPELDSYAQKEYEKPDGELEGTIAEAWSDILRIEKVGRHDNFFEIGGNSLSLLHLHNRLKRSGVEISPTDLFKYPTIEASAAHIVSNNDESHSDKPVLLKKAVNSEFNLFLVHDGSGLLFYAHTIADLIQLDINIYGLPAPELSNISLLTVEDMAHRLTKMVKQVQPNGDYNLAGWSFGGLLAYEIATQLIDAGNNIKFLGLFDTYYLGGNEKPKEAEMNEKSHLFTMLQLEAYGMPELLKELHSLEQKSDKLELHTIIEKASELKQDLMPAHLLNIPIEEVSEYLTQQRIFYSASFDYVIKPVIPLVHLFSAEEVMIEEDFGVLQGWTNTIHDNLSVIKVKGTHYSMMTTPNVEELASSLKEQIKL